MRYEGEYIKGDRYGKGKEYNSDGQLKFQGEFLYDKKWNGKCKEFDIWNHFKFEGEYINGEIRRKSKRIF